MQKLLKKTTYQKVSYFNFTKFFSADVIKLNTKYSIKAQNGGYQHSKIGVNYPLKNVLSPHFCIYAHHSFWFRVRLDESIFLLVIEDFIFPTLSCFLFFQFFLILQSMLFSKKQIRRCKNINQSKKLIIEGQNIEQQKFIFLQIFRRRKKIHFFIKSKCIILLDQTKGIGLEEDGQSGSLFFSVRTLRRLTIKIKEQQINRQDNSENQNVKKVGQNKTKHKTNTILIIFLLLIIKLGIDFLQRKIKIFSNQQCSPKHYICRRQLIRRDWNQKKYWEEASLPSYTEKKQKNERRNSLKIRRQQTGSLISLDTFANQVQKDPETFNV